MGDSETLGSDLSIIVHGQCAGLREVMVHKANGRNCCITDRLNCPERKLIPLESPSFMLIQETHKHRCKTVSGPAAAC